MGALARPTIRRTLFSRPSRRALPIDIRSTRWMNPQPLRGEKLEELARAAQKIEHALGTRAMQRRQPKRDKGNPSRMIPLKKKAECERSDICFRQADNPSQTSRVNHCDRNHTVVGRVSAEVAAELDRQRRSAKATPIKKMTIHGTPIARV